MLAGERGGRIVLGFDADNSPIELRRLGVAGREVVLTTTNGTAVLNRLQRMPVVLMGCLLNALACAHVALDASWKLPPPVASTATSAIWHGAPCACTRPSRMPDRSPGVRCRRAACRPRR